MGIDIFKPYLLEARAKGVFSDLILGDVRFLPFKDKSFDVTICMEVLEHLDKEDGEKLLGGLERVARKQILLTTPVGKYVQHPYDGNPYQEHKYIWNEKELKKRGYKVKGLGIRGLPRERKRIQDPASS
ncbi:class I SAM-dependent methyltransferase [Dehalococcoidales bacterium]|nr:class I SAM-dependent methyltransferase [Dehalococcoidales bacterium]